MVNLKFMRVEADLTTGEERTCLEYLQLHAIRWSHLQVPLIVENKQLNIKPDTRAAISEAKYNSQIIPWKGHLCHSRCTLENNYTCGWLVRYMYPSPVRAADWQFDANCCQCVGGEPAY